MLREFEKYYFHRLELENSSFEAFFACWYGVANLYNIKKKRKDARESTTVLSVCITETIIRISPWVYESLKKADCIDL